jgi:hypothetical protein
MARPGTTNGEYIALSSQEKVPAAGVDQTLPGPVLVDSGVQRPQRSLFNRLGRLAVLLNFIWVSFYLGRHVLPVDSFLGPGKQHNAAPSAPTFENKLLFSGETVRSNGTHDYKRTVLLVSIDGLRRVA